MPTEHKPRSSCSTADGRVFAFSLHRLLILRSNHCKPQSNIEKTKRRQNLFAVYICKPSTSTFIQLFALENKCLKSLRFSSPLSFSCAAFCHRRFWITFFYSFSSSHSLAWALLQSPQSPALSLSPFRCS